VTYGKLATDTKSLNFGQGFPNYISEPNITECLKKASQLSPIHHQYARSSGLPKLTESLANLYSPILKRQLKPMEQILISNGAYAGLKYAIEGYIEEGDEVVVIEPFFDCYQPMIDLVGAKVRYVPLLPSKRGRVNSNDWSFNVDVLKNSFSAKTKAVILNNPNNPLGKVFSREELSIISELCIKNNCVCICDEVYEWLKYDCEMIKMATLPGMWDRTITIGSAGKTFSVTGWKCGWVIAPAEIIKVLNNVHANFVYTCPTPIQMAVAKCIDDEINKISVSGEKSSYIYLLADECLEKRDRLYKLLSKSKFKPIIPDGGYFMLADISDIAIDFPYTNSACKDVEFVHWMAKTHKLALIPTTVFCSNENMKNMENYVRFCFIKGPAYNREKTVVAQIDLTKSSYIM
ncbi:hypothetical protein A3Q56_00618, partial [Intoshia linei]